MANSTNRCFIFRINIYYFIVIRVREIVINAIPAQLKYAVAAGIGLFITFLGLQNANIIVADPNPLVALGDLSKDPTLITIFGIVVTVVLMFEV